MKTVKSNPDVYWAADTPKKCSEELLERIDQYYRFVNEQGYASLWRRCYNYWIAGQQRAGQVGKAGDEGEYSVINVNHFRNLLLHILQLAVGQRPAFEPRAINSDVSSQKQTILARGLLDYYMREKRLERDLKKATEFSLIFGEGFVSATWNATGGKTYGVDPDTHIEVREGDLLYQALEPIDVIRDPRLENYRNRNWLVTRTYVNKYELMAKYPEFADKIVGMELQVNVRHHYRNTTLGQGYGTDSIPLYTFFHIRCDALEDGRQMEMLTDGTVLTDGPLPYRHLPVHRVAASDIYGCPLGYTVAYDLAALQENYDMLFSTITTNQEMFGVQNVLVPKGSGFNVVDMPGQMKFIEYDAENGHKPEAMNLLSTPPEIFKFLGDVEAQMMTVSGINSVSRGDPQASLKSGAALALVQSMAIQFNQALQEGYVELLEDVGTATIQMLQDYASVPRVAAIAGKYNRSFVQEFTKDDLSNIDRVIVDSGNPMMSTVAGKMELAQTMLQAGMIKNPDELLSVINTGNLQPFTQGKQMELLAIHQENEELREGRPIQAIITDDHVLHIQEHKSILADPEARKSPEILKEGLSHLQDHINMLRDPQYQQLLQLMGQQPLPSPAQPGQQPELSGQQQIPGGNANAQVNSGQPNQPNMPKNAMTGKPFNQATGGL